MAGFTPANDFSKIIKPSCAIKQTHIDYFSLTYFGCVYIFRHITKHKELFNRKNLVFYRIYEQLDFTKEKNLFHTSKLFLNYFLFYLFGYMKVTSYF